MLPKRAQRVTGLAMSAILLVVVLAAAIAIVIALSGRSNNGNTSQQQDKMLATTVLSQAQQIKTNFELAISNGLDISTVTVSFHAPVTTFLPASAGIPAVIAPVRASTSPGSFFWGWHGTGNLIKIKDVGTGAGNYAIEIDPFRQSVCQQIDQELFNNSTVPTVASGGWDTYSAVDATGDSALNGQQEGCFYSTGDARYFYFKIIQLQ